MKKNFKIIVLIIFLIAFRDINAQGVTQFGTPTNQEVFPKGEYHELADPSNIDAQSWKTINKTYVVWASKNVRYAKNIVPTMTKKSKTHKIVAWKGERVNAQFLVFANEDMTLQGCS